MKTLKQSQLNEFLITISFDSYYEMYMVDITSLNLTYFSKCFETFEESEEFFDKITESNVNELLKNGDF